MSWFIPAAAWVTALATVLLVIGAFVAWGTAKATLDAMKEANEAAERASKASEVAARAAEEANHQAREDSIRRTRPYVFVEIAMGISGETSGDLRIRNVGASAAHQVTVQLSPWPEEMDDIAENLRRALGALESLPPGCGHRFFYRMQHQPGATVTGPDGNVIDKDHSGMPTEVDAAVTYTDDEGHEYKQMQRLVMPLAATPLPGTGAEPAGGQDKELKQAVRTLKAIAWHLAELRR